MRALQIIALVAVAAFGISGTYAIFVVISEYRTHSGEAAAEKVAARDKSARDSMVREIAALDRECQARFKERYFFNENIRSCCNDANGHCIPLQ